MKKLVFIPLALFIGLVVFLFIGLRHDPREIPSPLINKAAPSFQLPQLHDPQKTLSAQDMRGKVWLLNFWGTWCIACREEHPWLLEYAKSNAVPIVGIDYKYSSDTSDERTAAMRMLAEIGNPYSLTVYDADGRVSIDYGVYGAPESFLIDKNGVIRFKQIGPITEDVWRDKIVPLARQLNQ
ncbi:MAG TPA: DsbE family thiol:disulfide interchange protein [Pyrinomonadaceae bacterium]|jgi:cytochrome c biogenesis protein CcmG/thiol:disulfide interchange protein DsbE|nr:DsbE family thiol:disulfide interchange protein [Pyrinomonadaceae bacterium]